MNAQLGVYELGYPPYEDYMKNTRRTHRGALSHVDKTRYKGKYRSLLKKARKDEVRELERL